MFYSKVIKADRMLLQCFVQENEWGKRQDGDFDVPQSVMCHQQPSLWLSVMMCLKELSGCRLIDHLKAPQARQLRRDDPRSQKKTV